MARHSQHGATHRGWQCQSCFKNDCAKCIEKARKKLMEHGHLDPAPPLCQCTRKQHKELAG